MGAAPLNCTTTKNDKFEDDDWNHLVSRSIQSCQHIDSPSNNDELMPKNTIVAAYTRHSTDKQDSKMQAAYIKSALKRLKKTVDAKHWFEEGTTSATKKPSLQERVEGAKLHALVKSGQVDCIVVYKLDRLFRKQWQAHEFVALCQSKGTDVFSMDSPMGILDDDGFILYSMNFMMAEMEARRIARRTKDGMTTKREDGKATTGAVFGWDVYDRLVDGMKETKIEPNWQEQAVINWIHARMDEGWSMSKCASTLNSLPVRGKRGGKWQSASISRMLNAHQHDQLKNFTPPKRMMKWPFTDLRKKQAKMFD